MTRQLSAVQAKSRLADCLREAERGESVIITRRGRPVAALVAIDRVSPPKPKGTRSRGEAHHPAPTACTVTELARALRNGPKPDGGYGKTLATITRRQPNLPKSPWRP